MSTIKTGQAQDSLVATIENYDALVVRSETKVTRPIIEAGTRLQVIGRAGVGVDNIDLVAATERGVIVVNAPQGNTIAAAEHTIALLMALARHIPQADASMRAGKWDRKTYVGTEVRGQDTRRHWPRAHRFGSGSPWSWHGYASDCSRPIRRRGTNAWHSVPNRSISKLSLRFQTSSRSTFP